jgi:hypothetical protein
MGYDRRMTEETHKSPEERLADSRITALRWEEAGKLYAHLRPESEGWSEFSSLPGAVKIRYYEYVRDNVPVVATTVGRQILDEEKTKFEMPGHLRPDDYSVGCMDCEVGRGTPHSEHESEAINYKWDQLNKLADTGLFQGHMQDVLDAIPSLSGLTDTGAHARIDALQSAVAFQLAVIKRRLDQDVNVSKEFGHLMATFEEVDNIARQEQGSHG